MNKPKFNIGDHIVYTKYETWHRGDKPTYIVTQIGNYGEVYAKVIGDTRTERGAIIAEYNYELDSTQTPSQ